LKEENIQKTDKVMKKQIVISALALALAAISSSVWAAHVSDEPSVRPASPAAVSIKSVKFADALLATWIAEYAAVHGEAALSVADKNAAGVALEVAIGAEAVENAIVIPFGRTAVLPIASKRNTLAEEQSKNKLNAQRIKDLYFE
jgi:hypothetical protein